VAEVAAAVLSRTPERRSRRCWCVRKAAELTLVEPPADFGVSGRGEKSKFTPMRAKRHR
jgi:hypothetical protein